MLPICNNYPLLLWFCVQAHRCQASCWSPSSNICLQSLAPYVTGLEVSVFARWGRIFHTCVHIRALWCKRGRGDREEGKVVGAFCEVQRRTWYFFPFHRPIKLLGMHFKLSYCSPCYSPVCQSLFLEKIEPTEKRGGCFNSMGVW